MLTYSRIWNRSGQYPVSSSQLHLYDRPMFRSVTSAGLYIEITTHLPYVLCTSDAGKYWLLVWQSGEFREPGGICSWLFHFLYI